MKHTENFKLRLPDEEDIYNVEDFNFNTETIDEEIGNLNTDIKAMKENFQAGVESTYEATKRKGSTPAEKTLAAIADAIMNIKPLKEISPIYMHNCDINKNFIQCIDEKDNEYIISEQVKSDDYTGDTGYFPTNCFCYLDDDGHFIHPYKNSYYTNFRYTIRIQVPSDLIERDFPSLSTNYDYDISYTGYYLLPDINFVKDKAGNLKLRIYFDIYADYTSSAGDYLFYKLGENTYTIGDHAGVLDTHINYHNYNIYTIDVQRFNDQCEISLYNEDLTLLERKVYHYDFKSTTRDVEGICASAYPIYEVNHSYIDIYNTFLTTEDSYIYGEDNLEIRTKYPFRKYNSDYQNEDVDYSFDIYENIHPTRSSLDDIIVLLDAVEYGRTIGDNIKYYWDSYDYYTNDAWLGKDPSFFTTPKYSLIGSNKYGSWNVAHDIFLDTVDYIYFRPVIENQTDFYYGGKRYTYNFTNGGRVNYIIVFSTVYREEQVNSCMEGRMIEESGTYEWATSSRRQWCNTCFRELITNVFGNIFKSFKCPTLDRNSNITYTDDYFALPSIAEVNRFNKIYGPYGIDCWSRDVGTGSNQAVSYYTDNLDRVITSNDDATTSYKIANIIGVI